MWAPGDGEKVSPTHGKRWDGARLFVKIHPTDMGPQAAGIPQVWDSERRPRYIDSINDA